VTTLRIAGIVLLGPPGSGKSHLGCLLARRGAARYTEFEPLLIARFGTGEAFAARKTEALAFLKQNYGDLLRAGGLPLVIESTGLSEEPILRELADRWRLAVAALRTPRQRS
jgi:shikimate kinase